MIHQAKERNPDALVIACGCYVEGKKEELEKEQGVDIFIGNSGKGQIVERIKAYYAAMRENDTAIEAYLPDRRGEEEYETLSLKKPLERSRAFVKIQDGCNQFCAYCIIPYVRGRIRSRKVEDCLEEIRRIGEQGIEEIVLTGIHLSSYGLDFRNLSYEVASRMEESGEALLHLIREIACLPTIKRIRLGSLEPRVITDKFMRGLQEIDAFCPHFHLSLQSGAERTLRRMNRHYTKEEFREAVNRIREVYPLAAITTDVIVGFPGESEEEFAESFSFIEEIRFYETHIFPYSKREGTRAAEMPEQVSGAVKKRRAALLQELNLKRQREFRLSRLGSAQELLSEETVKIDGQAYLVGNSREYVKLAVPLAALGGDCAVNCLYRGTAEKFLNSEILLLTNVSKT